MADYSAESRIEEIARYLKEKKNRGRRVGLFLGHRAGGLYNDNLYRALVENTKSPDKLSHMIKDHSAEANEIAERVRHIQSSSDSSAIDKFSVSYSFLGNCCTEYAIHAIFHEAISSSNVSSEAASSMRMRVRREDGLLAGMIKTGFFDPIITTNIDPLLEEGCSLQGMKDGNDYHVVIRRPEATGMVEEGKGSQIIKIFGDFFTSNYKTFGQEEFDLEGDQILKKFVISELSKDIIILGYDPLWDWPMERAFREEGGSVWYIDEERPVKNSHLEYVLNQRKTRYLVGPQGWYSYFVQELDKHLGISANLQPESVLLPAVATALDPNRKRAFVSYSRKDKSYLEDLQRHIKGYKHVDGENSAIDAKMDMWDDTHIEVGRDWRQEIDTALTKARIAILLISADFFASDFIRENELPPLLEAAQKKEIRLLPILLGPSAFPLTPLAVYQAMNTKHLMEMTQFEREAIWAKIAHDIYTIMNNEA